MPEKSDDLQWADDGWADVAVAVGMDNSRNCGTGSVQVFFNRGGTLEPTASYRTAGGRLIAGCALGDVDADGDLDLVVPVLAEGVAYQYPIPPDAPVVAGRARIYLNQDGVLSITPSWIAADENAAGGAAVADVNQDGWMDVAFSGIHAEVYYGTAPAGSFQVPIPTTPGWTSADTHQFSFSLDAGYPGQAEAAAEIPVPGPAPLMLAVASGCPGAEPCSSKFLVYRPDLESEPVWQSGPASFASQVLLADLNASGYLDLIADQWGEIFSPTAGAGAGAPLWFFQGSAGGFGKSPDFQTSLARAGEGLAVADLKRTAVRKERQRFRAQQAVAVLTLPKRRIVSILEVKHGGNKLATSEYAWAPGSNWVSLASPLAPGEAIEVEYEASPVLDVAEAVWQPQYGTNIYFSFLPPQP